MLQGHYGIVLIRAKVDDDEPCFHYMRLDRKQIDALYRDYQIGQKIELADYGEVIYSGWGEKPTPEEEAMIKAKYGQG